ncbi:MAG TPA: PEPxxWA-CTERM sorting domain-containing protein [Sphingobium sp.]
MQHSNLNARVLRLAGALALPAALLAAGPALAGPLSNGTGDGQVTIDVGATGSFSNANYNPVGPGVAQDSVYSSNIFFRLGNSGARTAFSQVSGATIVSSDGHQTTSTFSIGTLDFTLVQTLSDLVNNGVQTGSELTQSFSFVNRADTALEFSLARYLDGDLPFGNAGTNDGGGMLDFNGRTVLFETDAATGQNDNSTFLGIYNEGGEPGSYDVDHYGNLQARLIAGQGLRNQITNDNNGDGFIDAGSGYDVALSLENLFSLGAGQQGNFTTHTIFGSGTPGSVSVPGAVPEPASWAMMIAGLGIVGAAQRRRIKKLSFA